MTTAPETQTDQRVSISRNGGSFLLRVSFLSTPLIEREKRVAESKGLLRRVAQEGHGFEVPDAGDVMLFRFDHVDEAWILRASRRLEQHISAILTAPLSPKAVERALAITSRERIRW